MQHVALVGKTKSIYTPRSEFLYAREGIRISNYGCKGTTIFADLQVLEGKFFSEIVQVFDKYGITMVRIGLSIVYLTYIYRVSIVYVT